MDHFADRYVRSQGRADELSDAYADSTGTGLQVSVVVWLRI